MDVVPVFVLAPSLSFLSSGFEDLISGVRARSGFLGPQTLMTTDLKEEML